MSDKLKQIEDKARDKLAEVKAELLELVLSDSNDVATMNKLAKKEAKLKGIINNSTTITLHKLEKYDQPHTDKGEYERDLEFKAKYGNTDLSKKVYELAQTDFSEALLYLSRNYTNMAEYNLIMKGLEPIYNTKAVKEVQEMFDILDTKIK